MEQTTSLVTGASRGIGRALARVLASQGHRVILLARDTPSLREATAEVQSLSPSSFALPCDLASPESIQEAAKHCISQVKRLDVLVHNAGAISPIQPLLAADADAWARSMQVNVIGVQHLTAALAGVLQGEHRVRITTISSGASQRPLPSWSAYCTAKAALDMWARCLAAEGANQNISAISIAPGIVDTEMQREIRTASSDDFPLQATFQAYHENGDLTDPDEVAQRLTPLITEHEMEQSGQRFDVRDL